MVWYGMVAAFSLKKHGQTDSRETDTGRTHGHTDRAEQINTPHTSQQVHM